MRRPPTAPPRRTGARQSGAALLAAMLTVTLVATFAAAALWQQWRSAEVEAAERARMQSAWVLVGALDWSRLILREDGNTASGNDNLTEPWSVPLEEAKLTAFLAADKNIASDALEGLPDAFLSGRIIDAQSKLNVRNLVADTGLAPSAKDVEAFTRLFEMLGLPTQEVNLLTTGVQQALASAATSTSGSGSDNSDSGANAPLMPLQEDQLTWLGLSPTTVAAIAPYVTVLPVRTRLNINTASAEVLAASVPAIGMAGAKLLTLQRTRNFFTSAAAANALVQQSSSGFNETDHSVSTSYFEVLGRLRLDDVWVEERSLLFRSAGASGTRLTILWRQRGAGATDPDTKP